MRKPAAVRCGLLSHSGRGTMRPMESPPPDNVPAGDILPTTVLTGFLGSGKTSLLRRALADPGFTDTAVIVNEVGAIAIDHYLVDFVEGAVLELPGGWLCCAVRGDLARALGGLFERRGSGGGG